MDTEQIEHQMTIRRAAIDAKLDLLAGRVRAVRRKSVPVVIAGVAMVATFAAWSFRRRTARQSKGRGVSPHHVRKAG